MKQHIRSINHHFDYVDSDMQLIYIYVFPLKSHLNPIIRKEIRIHFLFKRSSSFSWKQIQRMAQEHVLFVSAALSFRHKRDRILDDQIVINLNSYNKHSQTSSSLSTNLFHGSNLYNSQLFHGDYADSLRNEHNNSTKIAHAIAVKNSSREEQPSQHVTPEI